MMDSFDIIADNTNLETIFIMESPYQDELDAGFACAGDSGLRMSKNLLNNEPRPFGELLKMKDASVLNFGVINAFPFPLEIPYVLNEEQVVYVKLKKIKWVKGKTTRPQFYHDHLTALGDENTLERLTNFKARLIQYVEVSPSLRNLVFCGYIAQSMYLKLFNQSIIPYNHLIKKISQSGREINILFVNHPSAKNSIWEFNIQTLG